MYNLLVSSNKDAWKGEPYFYDVDRCVRKGEFTDQEVVDSFGELTKAQIKVIKSFPCIFAYENWENKKPKFGFITEILKRHGEVKLTYEIVKLDKFLKRKQLIKHGFDLACTEWELNRTHWAIKDVDLYHELSKLGIRVPVRPDLSKPPVDINHHHFEVALSFPGESREYVEKVSDVLAGELGRNNLFYDNNFQPQLARPELDLLLQNIYRHRSKLIVVFLSEKYQEKRWCGLEWRAIREILFARENDKVMYVRMDDGEVDGIFPTDGYIDGRKNTPEELAFMIQERLRLVQES